MGWVFLMKSKSQRHHCWCNNALSDCHSNHVWQCQWSKAEREICQKVCCMFRVFVLLNKPAASSFPQFHHCCGSPAVLFGNCLVIVWLIIIMPLEPQQWWNWGNEEEMKWKNDGNEEWNQYLHVPTQRLVIVFQETGEWQGGQAGGEGGGRGDMSKIPPLTSKTSKAQDI